LVLLETASGVLADVEINVNAQFGYQVTTEAVFERGVATAGRASIGQDRDGSIVPADHLTFATRFADAYDLEVRSWVDASLQGTVVGPTSWDGYLAAVVCEAALEAQESGQRVEVAYADRPALYEA
jgi:myo-inositol 2-dehydrogenase/D-chiro-inositol 1-dehydrogenase